MVGYQHPAGTPAAALPAAAASGLQGPHLAIIHVHRCCWGAPPAAAVNRQVPEARPPHRSDQHPGAGSAGLAQNAARDRYLHVSSAEQQADDHLLRLGSVELREGLFSSRHSNEMLSRQAGMNPKF